MKIAVLGDSISEGIGTLKVNYCDLLKEEFKNIEIKNYARTGTMTTYLQNVKDEVQVFNPDILIIMYGNVDAMPRPKSTSIIYKILPNRYKLNGMLNPRALFTKKNKLLFVYQKLESYFRLNLNKILIKSIGYEQWNDINKFKLEYEEFVRSFPKVKILMISTVPVYDKWFPYCNYEYKRYNNVIKSIAYENNSIYIDIYNILNIYNKRDVFLKDYFHPSIDGYRIMSEEISRAIKFYCSQNQIRL